MLWRRLPCLAAAVLALATTTGGAAFGIGASPAAAAPAPADAFCSRVAAGATAGDVENPELIELSGLAASRAHPGVLWADNDSGDSARLFALSDTGADLGVYDVPGAEAIDWEDLAVGPGPDVGTSYLYIADIGDNAAGRDHVTVYRAPEPADAPTAAGGSLLGAEAISLVYPGGPEDAESLFIDPSAGDLFIVTKQISGASRVLMLSAAELAAAGGAAVTMTQVASIQVADTGAYAPGTGLGLPATMATAADISPDGRTILVRTYQQVLAFERADGESIADAFASAPCEAPQVAEPQGEAIAFAADGTGYYTSGEVQLARSSGVQAATDPLPLVRFAITAPPTPPAPTTTTTTTTPTSTTAATAVSTTTTGVEATVAATAVSTTTTTVDVLIATDTRAPSTDAATTGGSSSSSVRLGIAGAIVVACIAAAVILARRRARRSGR